MEVRLQKVPTDWDAGHLRNLCNGKHLVFHLRPTTTPDRSVVCRGERSRYIDTESLGVATCLAGDKHFGLVWYLGAGVTAEASN